MRLVVWSLILAPMCLFSGVSAAAQSTQPILPLSLQGEPHPTQVPGSATLAAAQCDESGAVYLRYATPGSDSSLAIAKVAADGSTQSVPLNSLPGSAGAAHAFIFSVAADGTMYEILRAQRPGGEGDATRIDYVRFDPDGSVRYTTGFDQEFIPSALVPLPSGNFFANGVTIAPAGDGVTENALGGIFSPDAKLLQPLRNANDGGKATSADDPAALLQGGSARLGDDGNIYALTSGDQTSIAVIRQSGRIQRVLHLQPPSDAYAASGLWASGGRLLVSYSGDSSDGSDSLVYELYDATTGTPIRAYHPEFQGTAACFDGETLTVLLPQASSGSVAIATADLE